MDKQKQIEEMARIICGDYNNGGCEVDGWVCNYNCEAHNTYAKALYEAGYRKIPEGAVVLEKVEYDKLVSLADECIDWRRKNCNVAEFPKENAVVLTREEYDELKKGIKTYNYTAMFDSQNAYRWEQGYLQGRKETAEKFAERAKKAFFGINCSTFDDWNWYYDKLDEIEKELGVGNG